MRRARNVGEAAVYQAVYDLINKFNYPFQDIPAQVTVGGGVGGGGMAHVLIVSDSEPAEVQDKADFVVPQIDSSVPLQSVFDVISAAQLNSGAWSIWMAGIFELDDDVTAPSGAWVRGLGYTLQGGSV